MKLKCKRVTEDFEPGFITGDMLVEMPFPNKAYEVVFEVPPELRHYTEGQMAHHIKEALQMLLPRERPEAQKIIEAVKRSPVDIRAFKEDRLVVRFYVDTGDQHVATMIQGERGAFMLDLILLDATRGGRTVTESLAYDAAVDVPWSHALN